MQRHVLSSVLNGTFDLPLSTLKKKKEQGVSVLRSMITENKAAACFCTHKLPLSTLISLTLIYYDRNFIYWFFAESRATSGLSFL